MIVMMMVFVFTQNNLSTSNSVFRYGELNIIMYHKNPEMFVRVSTEFGPKFFPRGLNFTQIKCRSFKKQYVRSDRNPDNDFTQTTLDHFQDLISSRCESGQYEVALYLLESMVNIGYEPDAVICTKLIDVFFKSNCVDKAVDVMDILLRYGAPDKVAYSLFVSLLYKMIQLDSADKALSAMKASEIRSHTRMGSSWKKTLEEMIQEKCEPNVITYTLLIQTTIKNSVGEAMKLFNEMLSRGIEPHSGTYNVIVQGMYDAGLLDDAFEFVRSLRTRGFKPNVRSYNFLLIAFLDQGKWDCGEKVMMEMLSRGLEPDSCTYNVIVRRMCEEGLVDDAFEFVRSLRTRGFKPDVASYNFLLTSFLDRGKWDRGAKVMVEMFSAGYVPNKMTCCKTVHYLHGDEAINFFETMIACGCSPDIKTYTKIIRILCTMRRHDEAFDIFSKLARKGPSPNTSTYDIIMSMLWRRGDKTGAVRLVSDMMDRGLDPRESSYNSYIKCLCMDGMVDSAIELLGVMKSSGVLPVTLSYNHIVHGLCRAGRTDDAIAMLEQMVEDGCRPNESSYAMIIRGIQVEGLRDEAAALANVLYTKNVISEKSLFKLLENQFL